MICPPCDVNFTALEKRFQITCCNRPASPSTALTLDGKAISICNALASAARRTVSRAAEMTTLKSTEVGVWIQSSRTSLPYPLLQNRACRKVGDQRVAMSTFPIAPFQTTHDRFRVTSLSSERFRGGQPRIMATLVPAFRISRTSQALTGIHLCHFAQ